MTGDDDAPHSNYRLMVVLSALDPAIASGLLLLVEISVHAGRNPLDDFRDSSVRLF